MKKFLYCLFFSSLLFSAFAQSTTDITHEDGFEKYGDENDPPTRSGAKLSSHQNATRAKKLEPGPLRLNGVDFPFSVRPSTSFFFVYFFGDTKAKLGANQQLTGSNELSYLYFGPNIAVKANVWRNLMVLLSINQVTASGSDTNGALFYGLDASYGHGEGLSYFVYEGDSVTAELGFTRMAARGLSIIPFQAIYSLLNQVVSLTSPQLNTYNTSLLTDRTSTLYETSLKFNFAFLNRFGMWLQLSNADSTTVTSGRTTNGTDAVLVVSPLVNFYTSRDMRLIYQISTTRSFRSEKKDLPWTLSHYLTLARASEFSAFLAYSQDKDGGNTQQLYYLGMNYSW